MDGTAVCLSKGYQDTNDEANQFFLSRLIYGEGNVCWLYVICKEYAERAESKENVQVHSDNNASLTLNPTLQCRYCSAKILFMFCLVFSLNLISVPS